MKVSIDPSKILFVFLFISYIPTFIIGIINIPFFGLICNFLILITCIYFFYNFYNIKNIYLILICGLFVYLNIVAVIITPEYMIDSTIRMGKCIGFVLTLEYLITKKGIKYTISVLMLTMEIFNYVNLFSMIIYPNGMFHTQWSDGIEVVVRNSDGFIRQNTSRVHWLLGHQTTLCRFTILSICIAFLYSYMLDAKRKYLMNMRFGKCIVFRIPLRSIFLIIACIFETLIANSAGNYVFTILFFAVFLISRWKNIIRTWHLLIGIIAFYAVGITLFINSDFIIWLSNFMGRSVSLLSRISIWTGAISGWLNNPLFGCGFINESSRNIRSIFFGFGNPHSDYYWILYEGGIVGIVIFAVILLVVGHRVENMKGKIAACIFASFVCLIFMMLDDDHIFRSQFMLIILSFCYHIPIIFDELKSSNHK